MPRISTDNYDTVASWNGSQDLFIVEQPDGTKVATPALLKQYVLAGVTETSEQYAECSTARNVAAKTVTLPGFTLEAGARISVRFTDTGTSNPTSGNITLNVNGTGAKEIVDSHTNKTKLTYTSSLFYNNMVNDFIYDGTYWVYMNRDNNTTYSSKTAASGGTATSLCTTGEKYTWNNKQNALTFDNAPTQNSNNPVKSGGVKTYVDTADAALNTAIAGKAYIVKANTSDTKTFSIPKSIWTDRGLVGSNHTAFFCSGYAGRISAGLLAISSTSASVIKLGENNVSAEMSGDNINITFTDTVYAQLYLILFN